MQACFCVDHHQQKVGLANCLDNLALYLDIHGYVRIVGEPAGIDQPELPPVPLCECKMAVPRRARLLAHYRAVIADDAVEQRRFPDVRPADDRYHGHVHAATACVSAERTSMKSYDAKTGIGSVARSSSKTVSSRKIPSSLIVSAGISAIDRSCRSASASRMSAPTRSPAVVIVRPNSEFSATISSKAAPVAFSSFAMSSGMIPAIPFPVTTPIRLPSMRGRSSTPAATLDRSEATAPMPFSICEKSP